MADAGLSLSHLILSHEIDMSVRQMSYILLYIRAFFS